MPQSTLRLALISLFLTLLTPLAVRAAGDQRRQKGDRRVAITDADIPLTAEFSPSSASSEYFDIWRDKQLNRAIQREAGRHHIDPLLLHAVVATESAGHRWARSRKGAAGPMQLMPATARRFHVRNRYDPDQSVRGGAEYLDFLIKRYHGDRVLAVAAYNAGEKNVDRYGAVPPFRETQNYVRTIAMRYQALVQEYRGAMVASVAKTSKGGVAESSPSVSMPRRGPTEDMPGVVVFAGNLEARGFVVKPAVMTSRGSQAVPSEGANLLQATRPRRVGLRAVVLPMTGSESALAFQP